MVRAVLVAGVDVGWPQIIDELRREQEPHAYLLHTSAWVSLGPGKRSELGQRALVFVGDEELSSGEFDEMLRLCGSRKLIILGDQRIFAAVMARSRSSQTVENDIRVEVTAIHLMFPKGGDDPPLSSWLAPFLPGFDMKLTFDGHKLRHMVYQGTELPAFNASNQGPYRSPTPSNVFLYGAGAADVELDPSIRSAMAELGSSHQLDITIGPDLTQFSGILSRREREGGPFLTTLEVTASGMLAFTLCLKAVLADPRITSA